MLSTIALCYLIPGAILAEIAMRADRKRGKTPTMKQFFNLVFIWPIVLYISYGIIRAKYRKSDDK